MVIHVRRPHASLKVYLNLLRAAAFLAVACLVVLAVNHAMRQQALHEAENKARLLLDRDLATRTYFTRELQPAILTLTDGLSSSLSFDPVCVSPNFAIRRIDHYFQAIHDSAYVFKECAVNARYPGNEADEYERSFIEATNAHPELLSRTDIRDFGGQPYFVYLRPSEPMGEGCLRCHGSPVQAPPGLVERYGDQKGFGRLPGEQVSAISVRVPLAQAYAQATGFSWRLSGILLLLLGTLFGSQVWLSRRLVFAPLDRIRRQALRIASAGEHQGDQIVAPPGRELAELVTAINTMSASLREGHDELERRVHQRTEELAQLTGRLQQDLAAQHRLAEALRISETRYRTLFDTVDDAVAIYRAVDDGADFVFLDFNAAGERIEGVQRQELINRSVQSVFPGVREFGLLAVLQRVWTTGQPAYHPTSLYQDNRITGWRENQVYKLPSGEIVAVYSDQTERRQAEAALLEERNRLKILIDNLPELIYVKDLQSRFVVANQAVAVAAGLAASEDLLGQTDLDLFPRELAAQYLADEQELFRSGQPLLDHEERLTDAQGNQRWILTSKLPLRDEQGEVTGLVGVGRDVTEHRRLEQELIRAQRLRAVGELSAGVSHNLNNILTAVLMPAQMLQRRVTDPAALELVQTILASGQRAWDLVRRLHLSVRGDSTAALQSVSLNEAVQEVVQTTRPRWKDETEARGIAVAVHLDLGVLPPVKGTFSGMHDLLAVLLFNALEAMPAGGDITVSTRAEDQWVRLDFSDTGVGMDEQTRLRIFEPFFTTKMDVGSGLGLPMLHNILLQWGGQVEALSTPGQGTTVILRFAKWEGDAAPLPQSYPSVVPRPGRILIVDDEQTVTDVLSRFLSEQHQIETCTDALAAMARFQAGRYDAVIVDLAMPGASGVQVAEYIRQADPAAARILLTGWELEEDDPRRAPFDFHLRKPVEDLEQLEALVRRAIELRDRRAGLVP